MQSPHPSAHTLAGPWRLAAHHDALLQGQPLLLDHGEGKLPCGAALRRRLGGNSLVQLSRAAEAGAAGVAQHRLDSWTTTPLGRLCVREGTGRRRLASVRPVRSLPAAAGRPSHSAAPTAARPCPTRVRHRERGRAPCRSRVLSQSPPHVEGAFLLPLSAVCHNPGRRTVRAAVVTRPALLAGHVAEDGGVAVHARLR